MRIGIAGLLEESNTFLGKETTLDRFREDLLVTGNAIRDALESAHHEIGGFFAGLDRQGAQAIPLLVARALPYGPIADSTYAELVAMLERELARAGELDGVLVACHGANVASSIGDVDGDWLGRIRRAVGEEIPVVATLDLHANLSPRMVEATDALLAYRTNPHLDQRERGLDAADLIVRRVRGEIELTQAARFPPLAINIERQSTSESPCREHFAGAERLLDRARVLGSSILLGFPYADVLEMGSAVVVVTDGDSALADRLAAGLARGLWDDRSRFVGELVDVESAVKRAETATGPACLLDMGDNVGGGSPGDGTILARALDESGVGPSLACLFDPASVQRARTIGVGGCARFEVGGTSGPPSGPPLAGEWTVVRLADGIFTENEPRHGGFTRFDQGPSAVLTDGRKLTLLVTSRRMVPFSLAQWTSCGVDPSRYRAIVAKGVHAPVAAYAPICTELIRVDTPGVTSANLNRLEYRNRRVPLFPLEREVEWSAD